MSLCCIQEYITGQRLGTVAEMPLGMPAVSVGVPKVKLWHCSLVQLPANADPGKQTERPEFSSWILGFHWLSPGC